MTRVQIKSSIDYSYKSRMPSPVVVRSKPHPPSQNHNPHKTTHQKQEPFEATTYLPYLHRNPQLTSPQHPAQKADLHVSPVPGD